MKTRSLSLIALVLMSLIAVSGIVNADSVPATIDSVKINGEEVADGTVLGGIVRGDTLEVKVKILATGNDDYMVIEASVKGLDHSSEKATAETDAFRVESGKTYIKTLNIELPQRMDVERYSLRIEVSNMDDDEVFYNAVLDLDSARNSMRIKDVIFSPENEVKAGRALLTTVRMKNVGEFEEEDVKVSVSLPELGLSASEYIDEVESEDSVTSEELYIRVPECVKAGAYIAVVTLTFDEGDETVSEEHMINVVENEMCGTSFEGKIKVIVSNDAQDVAAGESGIVYPVTLTNSGSVAKTVTISAIAGDWAEITVSPNVVVLGASETKTAYVTVAAEEDATFGAQTFELSVKAGESPAKKVTLNANVVEGASGWDKVKKGLEVALIVLVVLLVIIGLIVGFNRLKGDEDEEFKEETYY